MTTTARERRDIIRLYVEEQYSIEAIGQVVGRSHPTVRATLTQAGIVIRGGWQKRQQPQGLDPAQMVARYQAGEGIVELAKDLHVHTNRIRHMLLSAGVTLRPGGKTVSTAAELAQHPEAEQMVARYQAGETINAIASSLQRSAKTVRKVLLALGLTIKRGGSQQGRPAKTWRACHTCNVRIPLSEWANHNYTAHGLETEGSRQERSVDAYIAEHQNEWQAARDQAQPVCPGCGYSPCITQMSCGRRLRAQAQHHYQKEERRAA